MTWIEAQACLIKYALCRSRDEMIITRKVCEDFPTCNGCPYQLSKKEERECLNYAFSAITPSEIISYVKDGDD